jgi:hypothetical protein
METSKMIWRIATIIGGAVLITGCGGGGSPTVTEHGVCDVVVPQWTTQTASMQSVDAIKKALSPAWAIGEGGFYMTSKGSAKILAKRDSSRQWIFKRMASGNWMIQTLNDRKQRSVSGIMRVADQNWTYQCQFGGTLSMTNESKENDSKYTYRFSACEDSSEIMDDLFTSLFNGEPMPQPDPDSNATILRYNGTLSEELKECGDDSCTYAKELSFDASQFSVKTVRSDEDGNGTLGMDLSLWAGIGPDPIHYATLNANGCAAIDAKDSDGGLLNANLSFDHVNIDVNSTGEIPVLVQPGRQGITPNDTNDPGHIRVNLDGYAGLHGQYREEGDENLSSLDAYQFYAEGMTVDNVYDNNSGDDNLTVSGKFGDACMQGVVSYQGTVGPQWNDEVVPMDGHLSLNDGEATVMFNENNVTFLDRNGQVLQTFIGDQESNVSWDHLTDPQCREIYNDLFNIPFLPLD